MSLFDQTFVSKARAQSGAAPVSTTDLTVLDPFQLDPLGSATQAALALPDVSSAAGIANGSAVSAAETLNNTLKSLLSTNGTNPAASRVKAPVKDPIKSVFTAKASPSLNAFITNPARGTITDLNLGLGNQSADELSQRDPAELAALAQRLGAKVPTNDQELDALKAQAGKVAGSASIAEVFDRRTLMDGVVPVAKATSGSTKEAAEAARYGRFAAQSLGVSGVVGQQITSELSSAFSSGLPMLADTFGDAIPNLPTDVDPDTLDFIKSVGKKSFSLATDTFCNDAKPFAFLQNLFNGMLGLTAKNGILCALSGMLSSDYGSHFSAQAVIREAIPNVAKKGMSGTVEILSDAVGGGTVANRQDVGRSLIQDGYASYDLDTIEGALTTLSVTPTQLVSEPTTSGAALWSASKINAAHTPTLNTLLDDSTISAMAARLNPIAVTKWTPASLFS